MADLLAIHAQRLGASAQELEPLLDLIEQAAAAGTEPGSPRVVAGVGMREDMGISRNEGG